MHSLRIRRTYPSRVSGVAAQEAPTPQRTINRSESRVSDWFEQHRDRPPLLRAFVQRMPKGGDIHSHLSGAVYAESYLKWAAEDGYCVDPSAKTLVEPSACGQSGTYFPAAELFNRTETYDVLVNQWSMES